MLFSSSAYGQEWNVKQVRHNGERRLLKSGLKKACYGVHARQSNYCHGYIFKFRFPGP